MLCIAFKKRLSIIVMTCVMRQTRETSSLFYYKRLRAYKRRKLGKKPSVWSYTSECGTDYYSTKILEKLLKEFTSLLRFWKPERSSSAWWWKCSLFHGKMPHFRRFKPYTSWICFYVSCSREINFSFSFRHVFVDAIHVKGKDHSIGKLRSKKSTNYCSYTVKRNSV